MSEYKTLGDASRMIAEKHMQIIDSALMQYIKSAIHLLEAQGENIEDYALINVHGPMQLEDTDVRVNSHWKIVHVDKLEKVPIYGE